MADIKKVCKIPLHCEVIAFFHENQQTLDTPRGIAAWLDYDRQEIKQALDCLVKLNILTTHRTGATTAYAYTQDKQIVKQIEKFLENK